MTRSLSRALTPLALAAVLATTPVAAQDQRGGGGLLDGLFGNQSNRQPERMEVDPTELSMRINQLEAQVRQLTGTIEQLQYRNQQLEQQLRAQGGGGGGVPPGAIAQPSRAPMQGPSSIASAPMGAPEPVPAGPPPRGGSRSDAFDPNQNPNAPGVPRTLGGMPGGAMQAPPQVGMAEPPVGVPGGRAPGAPLDLSTMATGVRGDPMQPSAGGNAPLPPPPSRNMSATGAVASVAPPSDTPKDHYDLAYGYVLRKDYALADDAFQNFLKRFPNDRLVPEAQFWLGESLFQRQRYDAAAQVFLDMSTKHTGAAKAPDALLRLGQSLAALNQKEMSCATFAEIGRKYPRASNSVKQGVEREQKRVRC